MCRILFFARSSIKTKEGKGTNHEQGKDPKYFLLPILVCLGLISINLKSYAAIPPANVLHLLPSTMPPTGMHGLIITAGNLLRSIPTDSPCPAQKIHGMELPVSPLLPLPSMKVMSLQNPEGVAAWRPEPVIWPGTAILPVQAHDLHAQN